MTEINIRKDKPNFEIKLYNSTFAVGFNYSISTQPELVMDSGRGRGWLRGLNITILASPKVFSNYFQIEFTDIIIQVEDFGLELTGGDLKLLVDYFEDTIKSFIREYLLGQMNEQTRLALQGVINDLMLTVSNQIVIDDGQIMIDYSLVSDCLTVTDDYVAVAMDGTVHYKGQAEPDASDKVFTTMPVHDPDGAEIQLMVSEYTMNSVLLTAVEMDIIKYENDDQSSDNIDSILAGFERAFGEHPNVTIIAQASTNNITKYKPSIKIDESGALIEFYFDLHLRNPLDVRIDAVLMVAKAVTNITFFVNDRFELTGEIHSM